MDRRLVNKYLPPLLGGLGFFAIVGAIVWLQAPPKPDEEPCVPLIYRLFEKKKQGIPFTPAESSRLVVCEALKSSDSKAQ